LGDTDQAENYYGKSKDLIQKKLAAEPENGGHYLDMGMVLSRLGAEQQANRMANEAMQLDSTQYFRYAMLLCIQNRHDDALLYINKVRDIGELNYIWLKMDADFDNIRYHPGYQKLLAEGLHK